MRTDAAAPLRGIDPCGDSPAARLAARVQDGSIGVIDSELRRLARRVPALGPDDLDVVRDALASLTDSLILARLREAPDYQARLLAPLFEHPGHADVAQPPFQRGA